MNPPKLHIELVPRTCWFTNVRSQVSSKDWDFLRKETYKLANYQCESCNRKGRMEAHEIWHYDDKNLIQKLHSIVALCHSCHEFMHIGLASANGNYEKTMKHLAKVNKWTLQETQLYLEAVFEIWHYRSQKQWTLDLSLLDTCEIKYKNINTSERNGQFKKN